MAPPTYAPSDRPPPVSVGRPSVLYADADAEVRTVFAALFSGTFDVTCVGSGEEALEALAAREFDVLVSAAHLQPTKGSELLARAYESFPDTQRIFVAGLSDHDDLGDALSHGHVFAYVLKPWDTAQLRLAIHRAAKLRMLETENRRLTIELSTSNGRPRDDLELVARAASPSRSRLLAMSPAMKKVMAQVVAVAGTDASVLLHGETGTGKELIAAEIHERSGRRRARFVAQNLAALPPELMASELFGHVKGAFTGAQQARRGLFELADGGTLFLDEIGEAPMPLQALLLRALESHEFWPVGASEPRQVDVRIVAATNRDLLADAHQQLFRLDLYYRLAVCPIEVPPLRGRPEDVRGIGIPLLEASAKRMNREMPWITENAWRALEEHPWPGNVRELGNVMERLVIYHAGRDVEPHDLGLPETIRTSLYPHVTLPAGAPVAATGSLEPPRPRSALHSPTESRPLAPPSSYRSADLACDAIAPGVLSLDLPEGGTTFDELEREILVQVLARADNNQSRAARSLGMSESTFRSRMKRLRLKG